MECLQALGALDNGEPGRRCALRIRVRLEVSAPAALIIPGHAFDLPILSQPSAHILLSHSFAVNHNVPVERLRARGDSAMADDGGGENRRIRQRHHVEGFDEQLVFAPGARHLRQAGAIPKDGFHVAAQVAL